MHPLPLSLRWPLLAIAAFLALGAIPAGVGFALRPDGSLVGMPLAVLAGTPFDDFRIPGFLLAGAVGGSTFTAAAMLTLGARRATDVSVMAGAVTLGWIAAQAALLGYVSPLQPLVAVLGAALLWLGWRARGAA